jgi:hypothetical protein
MHGNVAAKYHIYPCDTKRQMSPSEPLAEPGDPLFDYLRTALLKDLSSQPACLRMAVQFFQNEATTPVNDSTVVWDTPFQDVAQIDIPRQTFGTPGQVRKHCCLRLMLSQEAFCSWMSFNPAATIADHLPVGNAQVRLLSVLLATHGRAW